MATNPQFQKSISAFTTYLQDVSHPLIFHPRSREMIYIKRWKKLKYFWLNNVILLIAITSNFVILWGRWRYAIPSFESLPLWKLMCIGLSAMIGMVTVSINLCWFYLGEIVPTGLSCCVELERTLSKCT
jgi:hypothetical protein